MADKYILLENGEKMPTIGFGMWQCDDPSELENAFEIALDAGYRHFDTAFGYRNEAPFGKILQKFFKTGKVKREDLFIVTKLPPHGVHHDRVEKFLKMQLEALQLDYVDLYLVHIPVCIKNVTDSFDIAYENDEVIPDLSSSLESVWGAMEAQVDAGRAKSIGISNYSVNQVERTVKCARILPAVHQIEFNPCFPRKELIKVCNANRISLSAYSVIGSPGRTKYYEQLPKDAHLKVIVPNLLNHPVVTKIARKHGKTSAQVLIRFVVQQGLAVIVKSVTKERLRTNIEVFEFDLDAADFKDLETLEKKEDGSWGFDWIVYGLYGMEKHPEFQLVIGGN